MPYFGRTCEVSSAYFLLSVPQSDVGLFICLSLVLAIISRYKTSRTTSNVSSKEYTCFEVLIMRTGRSASEGWSDFMCLAELETDLDGEMPWTWVRRARCFLRSSRAEYVKTECFEKFDCERMKSIAETEIQDKHLYLNILDVSCSFSTLLTTDTTNSEPVMIDCMPCRTCCGYIGKIARACLGCE